MLLTIQNVTNAVLTQLAAFWNAHGEEIMAFVAEVWATISDIYNTELKVILSIVIGTLQTVADFINTHGEAIQAILSGARTFISNVIKAALVLIQGLLHTTLAIMQGDWQGAWSTIQSMSVTFVQDIGAAIVGFLNMIAGFFGTSLQGIYNKWAHNRNQIKL